MATEPKTKDQVIAAFRAAYAAGRNAGNTRIQELAKQPNPDGKQLEEFGGSHLQLCVDGRTKLGKILAEISEPEFSIHRFHHDRGFTVFISDDLKLVPPVNGQEYSIRHDAAEAAAEVLNEKLGVPVYAKHFIN